MKVLSFFNSLILILAVFTVAAFAQTTFTNSTQINIPVTGLTRGAADPYPSNVTVSGLTGTVTDINVRLNGLSHTFSYCNAVADYRFGNLRVVGD